MPGPSRPIDVRQVVCAVELPGSGSLAPILLMRDGTYRLDPTLERAATPAARQWIADHGEAFRLSVIDVLC